MNNLSMWMRLYIVICMSFVFMAGCEKEAPVGGGAEVDVVQPQSQSQSQQAVGLMLLYQDTEPGIDPYDTRMLVNERFMRMDDGVDNSDYILLDRDSEVVYSVTHERGSILVIENRVPDKIPPGDMHLEVRNLKETDVPRIAGKVPVHYELSVNESICKHLVTVPGLLPEALRALGEFRRILASAHMQNLDKTPEHMQNPCFLAYDVFAPDRELQYGFPVQEWDEQGNSRNLINYEEHFLIDESLLQLPEGYQRQIPGEGL